VEILNNNICEDGDVKSKYFLCQLVVDIAVFQLNDDGPVEELVEESQGEEDLVACNHWQLPCKQFDGLWESLVYDQHIKQDLLDYSHTAMMFADRQVDPNLVSLNRVILLYGPPGTGKTSLCKALAQKLSIRMASRYPQTLLVEINAHSLFSKWFSESGKLVMRLFKKIHDLVEDQDSFICILIGKSCFYYVVL
jgi:hypothetical protein